MRCDRPFSNSQMTHIRIGNRSIGPGQPAYCIAELSANHNHDFAQATRIIEAAKEAGADAIKLQNHTPDTDTIARDRAEICLCRGPPWGGRKLHDLFNDAYTPPGRQP